MKTTTPLDAPALAVGARRANGTVRRCTPHPDELERHRVISADGYEVVVTTVHAPHGVWLTGAYPVQQGYLIMIGQPYLEAQSATQEAAAEQHNQLVRALADAGVGIVRARRRLAARQRAEQHEAITVQNRKDDLAVQSPRKSSPPRTEALITDLPNRTMEPEMPASSDGTPRRATTRR